MAKPKLTLWDKARIVAIEAHGIKRAAAGIENQPDIDRRIARVKANAAKRKPKKK
jgi:hypothetical protein